MSAVFGRGPELPVAVDAAGCEIVDSIITLD